MKLQELPQPINIQEKYLHGTAMRLEAVIMRLDALCEMMSSLVEAYANVHNLATTNQTKEVVEEKPAPKRRTRKKKGE